MLVYCHCSVACQRGGSRFEKIAALPLLARIVTTYREPPIPRMPFMAGSLQGTVPRFVATGCRCLCSVLEGRVNFVANGSRPFSTHILKAHLSLCEHARGASSCPLMGGAGIDPLVVIWGFKLSTDGWSREGSPL